MQKGSTPYHKILPHTVTKFSSLSRPFIDFVKNGSKIFIPFLKNFLYPPFCSTCNTYIEGPYNTICKTCLEELTLVHTPFHCQKCFFEKTSNHSCPPSFLDGFFSCFYADFTTSKILDYPEAAAAILLLQWGKLRWPLPDYLCITPGNSHIDTQYQKRLHIAIFLSKLWGVPHVHFLALRQLHLPEPFKALEDQSKPLPKNALFIMNPHLVVNKKILLLHGTTTTKVAVETSAKLLRPYQPLHVHALTFMSF